MQKIIFFTKGEKADSAELTAIENLNLFSKKKYEVLVRNSVENTHYGAGAEECDFVAGTLPTNGDYDEIPEWAYPEPDIAQNQAIVANGDTLEVKTGGVVVGTVTFSVADNVLTGTFVEA